MLKTTARSERDSNLELLRIVSMAMIVMHHLIVHGLHLEGLTHPLCASQGHLAAALFADAFLIVGVNLFVLISGYYRIRLRWSGILNLYLVCLFYQLIDLAVSRLQTPPPSAWGRSCVRSPCLPSLNIGSFRPIFS